MSVESIATCTGKATTALSTVQQQLKQLHTEKTAEEKTLHELNTQHTTFLLQTKEILQTALEQTEAPLLFGASKHLISITGWIPEKNVKKVEQTVQQLSEKNEVELTLTTPTKEDDVPIKLQNPKVAKPFEFFLRMFSLPSYNEIDPTIIMAITFPIFFGFILGDIGYGIIVLALFLFLKKKLPAISDLFNIVIISSISSIIFGILFGEIFGTEEVFGYHLPHVLSRAHQIQDLLYISVAIGIIHINLGLLLGFINEKMNHGFKTALFAKGSWFLLELGVLIVAFGNSIGIPQIAGYVAIAAAILGLIKGEGITGVIELPALFGNMLSYARLMAVGVASVSLAAVVNQLSGQLFTSGSIFLIIVGVFTLLIGHTINIILGVAEGILHPLRLHYVEFFGKFYKGSSTPYKPFGVKN